MSNLVTPMLTSVENSPTVDFYQSSMCFSNSPCAIINNGNDQICINDTSEWNDLEHLVGRTSLFKTSTPNKSQNIAYNKRIFSNNCLVANESNRIQESRPHANAYAQGNEHNLLTYGSVEHSKVINNLWNVSGSENNSCSKAGVNVNMGYNEGSSLESMVSGKRPKSKPDFNISKNVSEISNTKHIESSATKVIDTATTKTSIVPSLQTANPNYQTKTFKNGSKSGHSRQWGSCGSTATFQLNFDDGNTKSKFSHAWRPINSSNTPSNALVSPISSSSMSSTSTVTEIRSKSISQTNRLKRISQLSFEAEFDSEGRTHEQITIDFTKYEAYTMSGQITLIELSYFKLIKSEEFLSFKWTGLSKNIHAPGIVASTRWFNQLNFWAQRVILDCTELTRRSEMLTFLIRIIKKLVDSFNNLSSAMALMSSLEVECIHRLKQTWNCISNKDRATYRRMEDLFSSANNFEKLREHINSLKLPCIPYLGLYLTDLTYINLAHSKLSEFESQTKTDQINNILRTVSEFQQSEYAINEIPILNRYLESQRYIEELQKIIEENNYRSSMSLEPNLDSSCQNTRQQQDLSNFNSLSPQKTPPSYACKHASGNSNLQSPISPKPMPSKPHSESINELPEQVILTTVDEQNMATSVNDNLDLTVDDNLAVVDESGNGNEVLAYEDAAMVSSKQSDDDSVKATLFCGAGKKSQFKKRNSASTSLRFKRNSQSSSVSRQRQSSKTTTLSSTSQSALSDHDMKNGHHSKSLLDDSYLDATLAEPCTGNLSIDMTTALGGTGCPSVIQSVGVGDILIGSSKHTELLCAPPICKCVFKGDTIDLKPKATSKGKTEYSNLVNIAHAAEYAARLSKKNKFYDLLDNESDHETNIEDMSPPDDREPLKLICQGVLSRMVCLKNSKKSRFSMWNRQWMVLLTSKNNAFLVFFENSQFRALDRKDFKSKKCHVQDLRRVMVSRCRPTMDKCTEEPTTMICDEMFSQDIIEGSSSDNNVPGVGVGGGGPRDNIRKFFLTDKEYGTVYKFRDPSSSKRHNSISGAKKDRRSVRKRRSGDSSGAVDDGGDTVMPRDRNNDDVNDDECIDGEEGRGMPSLTVWYRLLQRCLRSVACVTEDNTDLIVLGDV